jgi:predicted O-linked N-acetylglucosamine transferase (SPINDLY family)
VTPQLAAIRARAQQLQASGKLAEAYAAHGEALRLAPDSAGIHLSAGMLAYALARQESSLAHFEQAARLDPRCYPAIDAALRICIAVGLRERALRYAAMAQTLRPQSVAALACGLLVPPIAQSREAIQATRLGYERALDGLLAAPLRLEEPDGVLGTAAFFLAYHGENDRDLQVKTARMFARLIPSLDWTAPHCLRVARRPGRLRVGFISRFFYSHSICTTSQGLVEQLSRERFEVYLLRITPSHEDAATARIRASADHALDLDAGIYRAREQIAALELDLLFYQDIGMEATSYFLAFARLAPVQCVSFGHPNTTGIPNLDYFVSNDLFEPPQATEHYSEKLFLLHDLPTLAYYERPATPVIESRAAARASLGLPAETPLYVCPQTLYKLHPDMDGLMRGILERDRDGLVVLIEGQFEEFTRQLRARFAVSMPEVQSRIVFVRRMNFGDYMILLAVADVILDTLHFNGMNSSLEAFAVGTPVVTLPSGLQRGRHTQAMYRKMRIDAGIATSRERYIESAVRIATDQSYRQELRELLLARNHVLFRDPRVVAEFERFFSASCAQSSDL